MHEFRSLLSCFLIQITKQISRQEGGNGDNMCTGSVPCHQGNHREIHGTYSFDVGQCVP